MAAIESYDEGALSSLVLLPQSAPPARSALPVSRSIVETYNKHFACRL